MISHGAVVGSSKEGLPRRLVQEHGGAVEVLLLAAHVLTVALTVSIVTEVTVTVVAGAHVGHVAGGHVDVTGGVDDFEVGEVVTVPIHEQALESLALEEEHGLANAGIGGRAGGMPGGAVYRAQKDEAELELPTKALRQLSLLQAATAATALKSPREETTLSKKDLETIFQSSTKELNDLTKRFSS
jgi:hypothetical protein